MFAHELICLIHALWLLLFLYCLPVADAALSESIFAFYELGMGTTVPPAYSPKQSCKAVEEVCGGMCIASSQ